MKKNYIFQAFAIFLALIAFYLTRDIFSYLLSGLLIGIVPFLLALIFAYLMYQSVKYIERGFRLIGVHNPTKLRAISVIVSFIILLAIISSLLYLTIPALIRNIGDLTRELPLIKDYFVKEFNGLKETLPILKDFNIDGAIEDGVNSLITSLPNVSETIIAIVSGTANMILVTTLVVLMCTMLLMQMESIKKSISEVSTSFFGSAHTTRLSAGVHCINMIMGGYFIAKITESAIVGVLSFIAFFIIGAPYAPFFSVFLAIFYLIPIIGGYIALIPTALLLLFYSPIIALLVLISGILIINFVGIFLSPAILESRLNLNSLTVVVSVLIGGTLGGIIGFIIAPPLAAIIKVLLQSALRKHNKTLKNIN